MIKSGQIFQYKRPHMIKSGHKRPHMIKSGQIFQYKRPHMIKSGQIFPIKFHINKVRTNISI